LFSFAKYFSYSFPVLHTSLNGLFFCLLTAIKPPKKKYTKYSAESLEAALRAVVEENISVAAASRRFGVPSRTLYVKINQAKSYICYDGEGSPEEVPE